MQAEKQKLGFNVYLETDYEAALERVIAALKEEGFGVLTEIDVQSTLKKKLDVDFRPYKILGACNPPLAHRALSAAPNVGMLLPCNVTVSDEGDGRILVSLINPEVMLGVVDDPTLVEVTHDARERLERVAASLSE